MADVSDRRAGAFKLLILLLILGLGGIALRYTSAGDVLTREGILRGIELLRSSPLAPLIFVPVYAGAVALAVPGTVATLAGGAVFGLWWGTVFNWLGATVGANLAYLLARFLGREGITQLLGGRMQRWPGIERLDLAITVPNATEPPTMVWPRKTP